MVLWATFLYTHALFLASPNNLLSQGGGEVSPGVNGVAGHLSQHRACLHCWLLLAQWGGQKQGILSLTSGLPCP